jgi:hypothetical protein
VQTLRILSQALFGCCFLLVNQMVEASLELKNASYQDRFFLRAFFRTLFLHDSAGHVLFFDTKPACLTCFAVEQHHQHYLEKMYANGWETWKKYDNTFPHPNFIFAEDTVVMDNRKVAHVFLINKASLIKCLEKHERAFKYVLGDDFTAQRFLTKVEEKKNLLPLIHYDECLLGLILGFEYESACAFKEQNTHFMELHTCPDWTASYRGINIKTPNRCLIFPVGFMGNPHSQEVQNLAKKYEWELQQLWIKYKQTRNTFRLMLEQLARISHTFSDSSHTLHDDLASQVDEAVLHEHCPRPLERQS